MVITESIKDNNDELDISYNAHHHIRELQGYTKRFWRNRIQTDFNVLQSVGTYEMVKNVILTSFYTGMMVGGCRDGFFSWCKYMYVYLYKRQTNTQNKSLSFLVRNSCKHEV